MTKEKVRVRPSVVTHVWDRFERKFRAACMSLGPGQVFLTAKRLQIYWRVSWFTKTFSVVSSIYISDLIVYSRCDFIYQLAQWIQHSWLPELRSAVTETPLMRLCPGARVCGWRRWDVLGVVSWFLLGIEWLLCPGPECGLVILEECSGSTLGG